MAMGFIEKANFDALLKRKYDLMQQEAASQAARAAADVANARTAAARTPAQNALNFAQAGLYGVQTDEFGASAASQRGLEGAQSRRLDSDTALNLSDLQPANEAFRRQLGIGLGLRPSTDFMSVRPYRPGIDEDYTLGSTGRFARNYAKGTARVPGKGSGKKDTVKAKLAPGEAVLNKAAADNLGRGMIAALNKVGARKMGLV